MQSMKNHEGVFAVGTRVRRAAKACAFRGVVVAVNEQGWMDVHWDGQKFPQRGFIPGEIRRA